jgi:hypothetical protein
MPTPPASPTQQPTRARYWVVFFAVTLAILAYIDRVAISQAAPEISSATSGSAKEQMGLIFSAFALRLRAVRDSQAAGWATGWARGACCCGSCSGGLSFTAATGWMWNFTSMWVTPLPVRRGRGGLLPQHLTKAFTTWLPTARTRPRAGHPVEFRPLGRRLHAAAVRACLFSVMSWHNGLPARSGSIGLVWGFFFYRWFRDNPADHPSVNAAELALLQGAEGTAAGHGDVPWRKLVGSRLGLAAVGRSTSCCRTPGISTSRGCPPGCRKGRGLSDGSRARPSSPSFRSCFSAASARSSPGFLAKSRRAAKCRLRGPRPPHHGRPGLSPARRDLPARRDPGEGPLVVHARDGLGQLLRTTSSCPAPGAPVWISAGNTPAPSPAP